MDQTTPLLSGKKKNTVLSQLQAQGQRADHTHPEVYVATAEVIFRLVSGSLH